MKKLNHAVFILILAFFALTDAAAQGDSFDDATLIQLKKTSAELMKNRKMRIVTIEERFIDGGKTSTGFYKTIRETLPPDRRRFISEARTASGMARDEFIYIGEKSFVRRDNGAWEVYTVGNGFGGYGDGRGDGRETPKVETTIVKTLVKGETINKQTVDLYKTVTTKKYIYPTMSYSSVSSQSFWFDGEGKLIRHVNAETYSRTTEDYEYDANIKIEAPIIRSKSKTKRKIK